MPLPSCWRSALRNMDLEGEFSRPPQSLAVRSASGARQRQIHGQWSQRAAGVWQGPAKEIESHVSARLNPRPQWWVPGSCALK